MEKILVITYSFGNISPVGVGNMRVVKALANRGYFVFVITACVFNDIIPNVKVITKKNSPKIPSRFANWVNNIVGREMNYYAWEKKAYLKSKKILKKEKNIIAVYTRSNPISVCPIGIKIKRKYHLPLLMHFSDPIPAPPEWQPDNKSRNRLIKQMKKYLPEADLLSFGNKHMLLYEEKLLGFSLQGKSFVSPDPATDSFIWLPTSPKRDGGTISLLFLGNIYGNRKPSCLFEAINNISKKGYHFKLLLFGDNPGVFPEFVCKKERTNNILEAMEQSDILIDIDGDDKEPVFISSKLKDYLSVNRPILAITPDNSPSREILSGLKTVALSRNNSEEIQSAILKLINTKYFISDYEERISVVESFSPEHIVNVISNYINSLIK